MMSRKDYRIIAAAIREATPDNEYPTEQECYDRQVIEHVADKIARALRDSSGYDTNGNRKFDVERFMEAAGF